MFDQTEFRHFSKEKIKKTMQCNDLRHKQRKSKLKILKPIQIQNIKLTQKLNIRSSVIEIFARRKNETSTQTQ